MKLQYTLIACVWVLVFICSCAAVPAEAPAPEAPLPVLSLSLENIEGIGPGQVLLHYTLEVRNPRPPARSLSFNEASFILNGLEYEHCTVSGLSFGESGIEGDSSALYPLTVELDLVPFLPSGEADTDEYGTELRLEGEFLFDHGERVSVSAAAPGRFPRIREPVFTITSIAVSKAELINTRLKVSLRIDNPNHFPVDLASFSYELYGAGRFWADGKEKDIFRIGPKDSAEADLFLVMNFINMRRELLDQVIAMRHVAYRFSGEASVSTGIEYLPEFVMSFDRSGHSPVIE
ncbi:LEA type 2 family protein [Treponema sp. OttesenSCG-928-L16]|nr:LEA type 2 family protein [Treponema sp. OttesenSCG-928-L16]